MNPPFRFDGHLAEVESFLELCIWHYFSAKLFASSVAA